MENPTNANFVHLPVDVASFGFVTRETHCGRPLAFRCGRDFLYYALHYYCPNEFGAGKGGATALERRILGFRIPTCFMWTMLHVAHVPNLLTDKNLQLIINNRLINNYWQLVRTLWWPENVSREILEKSVVTSVSHGTAIGIDISIRWFGLVDHVLFVYGYDDDNYYVIDTLKLPELPYEKILNGDRFLMKLPKREVWARLRPISRIWQVVPRGK